MSHGFSLWLIRSRYPDWSSAESKPINKPAPQDEDPRDATPTRSTPWPVRRGGWALALHERSLAIAFFAMFFASVALHAWGGVKAFNGEQLQHGEAAVLAWRYVTTSQFWFRIDAELALVAGDLSDPAHRGL